METCSALLEAGFPTPLGGGPDGETPASILSLFNTIILRIENLSKVLSEERWQHLIATPHVLYREDPEFYPRILLRSKGFHLANH